jgi:nucleotide-binding universal stress UspA family protein
VDGTTILVPLDLSADADRALSVGAALAANASGHLDVVVVSSTGLDPVGDEREARAHARAAGVELERVRLRYDADVAAGILDEAASDRSTLCLATHARGRLGRALLGSTSNEIVSRSEGPLVLVGPHVVVDPRPRLGDVLVCIDGSPASRPAVETSAAWARRLDAKVRAVQVAADIPSDGGKATDALTAQTAASILAVDGIDATWEFITEAEAAEGILRSADTLDSPLIVIGTRRRSTLGAVMHAVVRQAHDPVLVVPG